MLEFHLKQEAAKGVNHTGIEKGVLVPVACHGYKWATGGLPQSKDGGRVWGESYCCTVTLVTP